MNVLLLIYYVQLKVVTFLFYFLLLMTATFCFINYLTHFHVDVVEAVISVVPLHVHLLANYEEKSFQQSMWFIQYMNTCTKLQAKLSYP